MVRRPIRIGKWSFWAGVLHNWVGVSEIPISSRCGFPSKLVATVMVSPPGVGSMGKLFNNVGAAQVAVFAACAGLAAAGWSLAATTAGGAFDKGCVAARSGSGGEDVSA